MFVQKYLKTHAYWLKNNPIDFGQYICLIFTFCLSEKEIKSQYQKNLLTLEYISNIFKENII